MNDEKIQIGKKYNKLLVLCISDIKYNRSKTYKCLCDCGKIVNLMASRLKSGQITCGCESYPKGKFAKKYTGFEDISGSYFSLLKYNAKKRKMAFEISVGDVWEKYICQNRKCYLSGMDVYFYNSITKSSDRGLTASVDRIDSSLGYTIDNIAICHHDINKIKIDYDIFDFINLCKKISSFSGVNKIVESPIIDKGYIQSLRHSAIKRKINFDICVEDIQAIFCKQGGVCAFSGDHLVFAKNYKERKLGIQNASVDRINNNEDYTLKNIQIIHKKINFSRQSFSIDRYKELCKIVVNYNS
jgi:hypothetical protein